MSILFVLLCVFQTGLPVDRFSNANFFTAVQTRVAASFAGEQLFPLNGSSENMCTRTSGNGRKFGISQRDVQLMFFKCFRGMSMSIEPCNLQTPDRIYGVQQQVVLITHVFFQTNCCIGLTAGVGAVCLLA